MTDNLNNIRRHGEDFSATRKFYDWIKNPDWQKGYDEVANDIHTVDLGSNSHTGLWYLLSASNEEFAADFYERIHNLSRNLHDIETCELQSLLSYAAEFDIDENLNYLSYPFPEEIYRLISLFSIDQNILTNLSVAPLLSSSINSLFPSLSASYSTIISGLTSGTITGAGVMQYYDNTSATYTDDEWTNMQSLSANSNALDYGFSYDPNFLTLIEDSFEALISSFVLLQYRTEEINQTPSSYIWQNISADLTFDNILDNPNSDDDDILKLKISLGIDVDFPEVTFVDDIENGTRFLKNFSPKEQIVLEAEISRRHTLADSADPLSRYSYAREKKVKEYFKFISNFSLDDVWNNFDPYDLDSTKLVLVQDKSSNFIEEANGISTLNGSYIKSAAKYLTNICLRTNYFRNMLKNTAMKYSYSGTSFLIKKLVSDYMQKYVYELSSVWRYNDGVTGEFNLPTFEKPTDFRVKVIDYWDNTEYFNISAFNEDDYERLAPAELISTLNFPFWLFRDSIKNTLAFTEEEIVQFYKENGLTFDESLTSSLTSSQLQDMYYDFLERVWDSGALSAYDNDYKSSVVHRSNDLLTDAVVFSPSSSFFYNWRLSGYLDYTDDYIIPPIVDDISSLIEGSGMFTPLSSNFITTTTSVSATIVPETDYLDVVSSTLNSILDEVSDLMSGVLGSEALIEGYRETLEDEVINNASAFNSFTYLPDVFLQVHNYYTISGPVTNLQYFDFNGSDALSGTISAIGFNTLIEDAGSVYIMDISGLITESTNYEDPFKKVLYAYINNERGYSPHTNIKNRLHPSYMLHPFLDNFVASEFSYSAFKNLLQIAFESDAETLRRVSRRINEFGNTVDSWRYDNRSWTGYSTYYEENPNLNEVGQEDEKIAIDGPWNFLALSSYLVDPASFISGIADSTNEFYEDLGLSLADRTSIVNVFSEISATSYDISSLIDKHIYQYAVDAFDNHYMLYKANDEFETSGNLWLRLNNHPLALPFNKLASFADHSSMSAASESCYDFNIVDNMIWALSGNPITGNVVLGIVYKDGDLVEIQSDPIHNFEYFTISSNYRYAGTYSVYNEDTLSYNLITLATSGDSDFGGLPYDTALSSYIIKFKHFIYNQEYGEFYDYSDNHYVKYDEMSGLTDTSKLRNIYKVNRNNDSIVTLAFEGIQTGLSSNNWSNVFGISPSANYIDLYNNFGSKVVLPENNITLLSFSESFSNGPFDYLLTPFDIRYVYPFSDLTYVGIFAASPAANHEFTEDESVRIEDNLEMPDGTASALQYNIQFFSNAFPSSGSTEWGLFSIASAEMQCYTSMSGAGNRFYIRGNYDGNTNLFVFDVDQDMIIYDRVEALSGFTNDIVYAFYVKFKGRNKFNIIGPINSSNLIFREDASINSGYCIGTENGFVLVSESIPRP